jgi:histidinol dehydrogenase
MILKSVEEEGDRALAKWSKLLDGFSGESILVPQEKLKEAWDRMSPEIQEALKAAAARIRAFHEKQPIPSWTSDDMGGKLGQRFTPIERVGAYVPGGSAPLPSSMLMCAIPARVAGVKEIVVATPPEVDPSILAAGYLCGVDAVYQVGGAQAIAAMAFGTETIRRVDKIVGAGNLFVTLAKMQVFGVVGLDGIYGPTETVVIADSTANPAWVAADLLAQAEHDMQATAILFTTDMDLAQAVHREIDRQLATLSRSEIITATLDNAGGIILVDSLDQAARLASDFATEHLCLSVAQPEELMAKINNAGGFFLGDRSYEVLGDYVAGPTHVMPTGGSARFIFSLNILDFVKLSSVIDWIRSMLWN